MRMSFENENGLSHIFVQSIIRFYYLTPVLLNCKFPNISSNISNNLSVSYKVLIDLETFWLEPVIRMSPEHILVEILKFEFNLGSNWKMQCCSSQTHSWSDSITFVVRSQLKSVSDRYNTAFLNYFPNQIQISKSQPKCVQDSFL